MIDAVRARVKQIGGDSRAVAETLYELATCSDLQEEFKSIDSTVNGVFESLFDEHAMVVDEEPYNTADGPKSLPNFEYPAVLGDTNCRRNLSTSRCVSGMSLKSIPNCERLNTKKSLEHEFSQERLSIPARPILLSVARKPFSTALTSEFNSLHVCRHRENSNLGTLNATVSADCESCYRFHIFRSPLMSMSLRWIFLF
jgi:DNA-binding FrmR family transcriptional regulator